MWQVRLSNFDETGEDVAESIVRCLSPAGYLQESAPQIARKLGVSTLKVETLVRKIQQLDPVAIGSRNLAECLWVQANHPEHPVEDPLVRAIIAKHLHNLEIRNYQAVARTSARRSRRSTRPPRSSWAWTRGLRGPTASRRRSTSRPTSTSSRWAKSSWSR